VLGLIFVAGSNAPAEAAIVKSVSCFGIDTDAADTTVACSLNIPSQSEGLLLCGYATNNNVDLTPAVTWTGGSQSMTPVPNSETSAQRYQQLFYLLLPTAANSTIDTTGGDSGGRDALTCKFYYNVDQGTTFNCTGCTPGSVVDVVAQSSNVTQSNISIPSSSGDVVFSCLARANSSATTWTATTATTDVITDQTLGAGGKMSCADDDTGSATLMAPSWGGGAATSNSLVSVNIIASSAAPSGPPVGSLNLLGVGK
jgi:hypothetical protein